MSRRAESVAALREGAVRAVEALQLDALDDELLAIGRSAEEPAALRLEAPRSLAPRSAELPGEAVDLLIGRLPRDDEPLTLRDASGVELRFRRNEPRRLERQETTISRDQLRDLLAFLLELK